jgi:hypothetical protein
MAGPLKQFQTLALGHISDRRLQSVMVQVEGMLAGLYGIVEPLRSIRQEASIRAVLIATDVGHDPTQQATYGEPGQVVKFGSALYVKGGDIPATDTNWNIITGTAPSGVVAGTYGSSALAVVVTVNSSGAITSISEVAIDHDLLLNYVADEHVAHSGVTITAGDGLTGGGDITLSRTLNVGAGDGISVAADSVALNITGLTVSAGIDALDEVAVYDVSSGAHRKVTAAALAGLSPPTVPAGSDGQVQYNNGGVFGGAAGLGYDDINQEVGIGDAAAGPEARLHVADGQATGFAGPGTDTLLIESDSGTTTFRMAANSVTGGNQIAFDVGTIVVGGISATLLGTDRSISLNVTGGLVFTAFDVAGGLGTQYLDLNSNQIKSLEDPTDAQDAATKNYADTTFVPLTRTLTAGAGLTGGGTLAADRTIDVVSANSGIVVAANDIALTLNATSGLEISTGLRLADSIAGGGLTISSKVLEVGAGTGITVAADSVAINQAFTPTWTGAHIFANTTTALQIGNGAAGIDYRILFDGETNDGTITFLEDEALFSFSRGLHFSDAASFDPFRIGAVAAESFLWSFDGATFGSDIYSFGPLTFTTDGGNNTEFTCAGGSIIFNSPAAFLDVFSAALGGTMGVIIPPITNTHDLGSNTLEYRDLYLSGAIRVNTITNDTGLAAGVYTPTRSAEANLDANVTPSQAQYSRIGSVVTVTGRVTAVNPTAPGAASFELSLPVASNIGAAEDLAGVAFSGAIAGQGAAITGSVANNTAVFTWVAVDVTSQAWSYTYSYRVI